jgi:hypothetical protein
LSFLGTAYIFLGSAGNSLYDSKVILVGRLIIGIVTILFVTILSLAYAVETPVFDTTKEDGRFLAAYIGAAVLGAVLLILQLIQLIGVFFSLDFLKKHAWLEAILTPGAEKMERRTKLAAQTKMARMVDNALVYHADSSHESARISQGFQMTARGTALLNFQIREDKTERCGGILWGWKRVLNNSIFDEEGIWLHSRLVSSTLTQFFICIFLVVFFAIMLLEILQQYNSSESNPDEPQDDSTSQPVVYLWE